MKNGVGGASSLVKWIVEKILPWVVMAVIGFGFEMLLWRVEVNDRLRHSEVHVAEMRAVIDAMKVRMDLAVSTGAGGHMTHREFNIQRLAIERRLERAGF